jgi:HK97 family phage major capsid protein
MPVQATTSKFILFGDFRAGYLVRQALDVQMVRLAERYADYLQVGFFGFMRVDATPDDTAAVRHLACSS